MAVDPGIQGFVDLLAASEPATLSSYDGGIHGMFSMALTSAIGRRFMDQSHRGGADRAGVTSHR